MTKINRMVMRGFKSFGEKTELVFNSNFNCVLGPNGSGKCLTKEALVQLADGKLVQIGELVNEKAKTSSCEKVDDGYIYGSDGTEVLCFDTKNYTLLKRPIKAFVKRTAPGKLLSIKTRSGRQVTTTPYHPLFILKDGAVVGARADELKQGLKIAVPRQVSVQPKTKVFYELLDAITEKDALYVPWSEKLDLNIRDKKKGIWKDMAADADIPFMALRSFVNKQAILFAHLVTLLRSLEFTDDKIIALIPKVKAKAGNKIYPMPWINTPQLARLLGYLLAEGRLTDTHQVWFTNGTEEIVKDYAQLMQVVFSERASINEYKANCWDVIAYSKPLQIILSKFGMPLIGGSEAKTISPLYLSCSSDIELGELLNGLYCGDGYVSKNSIELTTKSKKLATAVQTILTRIGVLYQSKEIVKVATNSGFSGKYVQVSVYGYDNFVTFAQYVPFVHPMKQERLLHLTKNTKGNPNLDLIDVNALVKHVAVTSKINVKKTKKQFPKLDAYCYNQCTPSRPGVQQLIEELFVPVGESSQQLVQLQKLAYSNIYWDEIVEIKEIEPTDPWVYDLCVDEHHNFVANNIFVHNSNIGDGLCFVLGKGSAKGMRAEKSAHLIYNGGKSKKPAKEGEVSIYFDNVSKIFPQESEEIKITRIIRHSGGSIYKINDQRKTRQEIIELLRLANIDPDGHNIVLQGDIIRFIDMSSVQRRSVVEEIAGIGIYEEKKQKALKELEKVDTKLTEADIILTERKTYLKDLKKERDQAAKYKELADKITRNNATYLGMQMRKRKNQKEKLEKQVSEYDEKIKKKDTIIVELKGKVGGKKEKIQKLTKEVEEKGEKEQVQILRDVEQLKADITSKKDRIGMCENEKQRIATRKDQLRASLSELDEKIVDIEKRRKEQQREKERLEKEAAHIQAKIEKFRAKNKLEGAEDIDKEIDAIDSLAEEKQKELQTLREKQQELFRAKDKVDYQLHTLDERIAKVLELEKEHKGELETLKQMKQEFKKATLELNQALQDDASLGAQYANARDKFQHAQDELAKLQARQTRIREHSAGNIAVQRVLEAGSKLGKVHGLVSELGQVKSKYALALEISAGAKLRSIVVEDDKTAANCITFLKQNKLGVATFLPMNKVRSVSIDPKLRSFATGNGVHGFATDLVNYDSKFKSIFSYVFGSTLVVDNIDVARRIGVGTLRMTTLDGDLVETSGAMQGGYRQRKKGGLGFQEKEVVESIKEMEAIFSETERLVRALQDKRADLEKKIVRLREFKANLEGDIITKEKSLHLDSDDIGASKQQKKELQEQSKQHDNDLEATHRQLSVLNKDFAQLKMKKQKLRDAVAQLRNPLLIAELNTFEQKKREIKEKVIELDANGRNMTMQIQNILVPEKENVGKIVKQHEKEHEQFVEEVKNLHVTIKDQEKDLKEKEKKQREFYGAFKGLFRERDQLSEELQKLENTIIIAEETIRSVESKKNAISIEHARVSAEFSGMEEENKKYAGVDHYTNKNEDDLKKEIWDFERMVQRLGNVNLKALEIYDQVQEQYDSLLGKKDSLLKEKDEVFLMMNEIETKKKELFMKTFDVINEHFQEIFSALSTKGQAYLAVENEKDLFNSGVNIKVRITSKKFMDIRSLSGGEKTMTALALIFAIQEYDPASFYIFDEVDAALDKVNSDKLAKLVRKYSGNAQYILISHNDGVIAEADTLYGVSMTKDNMSKVVSLRI